MSNNYNLVATTSPVSQTSLVTSFLDGNKLCAHKAAAAIDNDPHLSAAQKDAQFGLMRAAPLLNPSSSKIDEIKLSKKIELCMFMALILDSDSLEDVPYRSNFDEGMPVGGKSRPISALPNQLNYPRPASPHMNVLITPAHQYVTYSRQGGKIKDRVNELCKEMYKTQFYDTSLFARDTGDVLAADLRRAENIIKRLARETQPMSIGEVKS